MGEAAGPAAEVTDDKFLGGCLNLLQPKSGYRAGIDAVMLAAAVPAKPGDRAFEAGIGFAAAALCLAARVPDVSIVGIEIDEQSVGLAAENARRNGFADRVRVVRGDAAAGGKALNAAGLAAGSFDHAYANPPFFAETKARAPRDSGRARAMLRSGDDLDAWVRLLTAAIKPRGTASLILPASAIGDVFTLFAGRLGGVAVLPLHPRAGMAASRVIVQGVKGSRAQPKLMPGLVLHADGDGFTEAAEAILRRGAALPLGESGELSAPAGPPK